ncbi:MAG: hypothetical protein KF862_27300 [Chitinophagaceae bacterium]|nr:hypothetical protein [Chitinophagaceae bacterium]
MLLLLSCDASKQPGNEIYGTWRSLWEDDMTLQLQLHNDNRFKVTLNRTGQTHTNSGWYTTEGNLFLLKDSVNYPLPVCNLSDTGRYHFEINMDTLRFKAIDDPCERRAGALQLERFVRVR